MDSVITSAEQGKSRIFYSDASHFIYGAYPGQCWCFERLFIKTSHGRKRFNVTGAYDPIHHKLVSIEDETNVNSQTICHLLRKIRCESGRLPVTVILDNARYNHSQEVKVLAKQLNITLEYLPPYSPNLNLIERYWKYLKSRVLNSRYYESFTSFKDAIQEGVKGVNKDERVRRELKSLMTLNFQTFKNMENTAA